MKKTVLLLSLVLLAVAAQAQQTDSTPANSAAEPSPEGTLPTSVSFPIERVQTPTNADIYCAGFLTKQSVPNANFVAGGEPNSHPTQNELGGEDFLFGGGPQQGRAGTPVLGQRAPPHQAEVCRAPHRPPHTGAP